MTDKVWIKLRGAAGWGCECMAATLPLIEQDMLDKGLIKHNLDVYQWGYNPGVVARSAGTHDLGGVIDVGQYSLEQRRIWAKWGVMVFPRTTAFGWLTGNHGHGVWHGCPHQVPYADWQVRAGINGGDGLGPAIGIGKRRRNFEHPTMTWQEAVAANQPKVSAATVAAAKVIDVNPAIYAMGKGRPISWAITEKAMRSGKPSGNVKIVQTILQAQKANGVPYYAARPDGIYGPSTKAAVKKYQQSVFHTTDPRIADGWLGWNSFSKLTQWAGWRPVK